MDYLNASDGEFRWRVSAKEGNTTLIHFVSQIWQGSPWVHALAMVFPEQISVPGSIVLEITGGAANETDLERALHAAESTGIPVAVLFDIPNQPLWDMIEDDLIAHTFEKFLETDDTSWPLLFPMAKAALLAMEVVQRWGEDEGHSFEKFILTGSSKRGWTSWLAAATGDPRIVGIAPRVFDNLNIAAQLRRQTEYWGDLSPMLDDYARRQLQLALEHDKGLYLAASVDPLTFRENYKCPAFIVNGANDAYWTVDAVGLYWNELRQDRYVRPVPNAGHFIGDRAWEVPGLDAFVRSCAGLFDMPALNASCFIDGGHAHFAYVAEKSLSNLEIWFAESDDMHFDQAQWTLAKTLHEPTMDVRFLASGNNLAVFGLGTFDIGGESVLVGTPPVVFRSV